MKLIQAGLIALLISIYSITVYAQQAYTLIGTAIDMAGKKVDLMEYYGDKNRVVSSTTVDMNGFFLFSFSDDSPVGMYRLSFEKGRRVNVIYNREDIKLSIGKENVQAGSFSIFAGIDVLSSGENKIYYGFLQTLDLRRERTILLNQLKLLYPSSKDKVSGSNATPALKPGTELFHDQIDAELRNLHKRFEASIQQIIDDNPDSFAAKIIKSMKTLVLDVAMSGDGRSGRKSISGIM